MTNVQENRIIENTIINGDCLNILPQLPAHSFHFCLTDPPYAVRYKDRAGRSIMNDDNTAWLVPAFAEIYRVLANNSFCLSFLGWGAADHFIAAWRAAGFRIVGHLVFPKRYASKSRFLSYQHESAYLLAKGYPHPEHVISDVQPWKYSGNMNHPTEKAVEVLKPLIAAFSKPGSRILDPFCGSGSTCIASKLLGRHYLGIELDAEYHRLATQRLNAL
ncbi:MAG TPA: DNA methyltransferase [Ktedonobacteraceae bacterium]|nr:DNA methyltransferase [Ktedonobacteraceae bacterium]